MKKGILRHQISVCTCELLVIPIFFKGEAVIYGAIWLLVSRQVRAHLWHEGPAGGLKL